MATRTHLANPVLPNVVIADPTIRKIGGRFYLYATDAGAGQSGFHVWSSADLVDWQAHGLALLLQEVSWANGEPWAPDLFVDGDRFLFYFCSGSAIGVAESSSPTGPFVDVLGYPLVAHAADLSSIDPMVFRDDDGRAYLYWGSGPATWLEDKIDTVGRCMYVRELAPDLCHFIGDTHTTICSHPEHIEGSYMIKRQGRYLFMWSAGNWTGCDGINDYHVHAALADSPLGPFTPMAEPVLQSHPAIGAFAPGHHSMVHLPEGDRWLIVYHAHPADEKRRLYIDELQFSDDGLPVPMLPTTQGIRLPV